MFSLCYREEELSIASPTESRKNVIITEALISSPRVKGRAEMKAAGSPMHNGNTPAAEEKHIKEITKEQKAHKKGLREYFLESLNPRKSPAGTEGSGSWTMGTLEHKKKKDTKRLDVDLHQQMKLTEKDIEALIKSDTLDRKKDKREKKKANKGNRNLYADSGSEQEIVVIRLDPSLETPKKSRKARPKEDKVSSRKEEKKLNKSFDKHDGVEKKMAKVRPITQAAGSKKEKTEPKEWPKVREFVFYKIFYYSAVSNNLDFYSFYEEFGLLELNIPICLIIRENI